MYKRQLLRKVPFAGQAVVIRRRGDHIQVRARAVIKGREVAAVHDGAHPGRDVPRIFGLERQRPCREGRDIPLHALPHGVDGHKQRRVRPGGDLLRRGLVLSLIHI